MIIDESENDRFYWLSCGVSWADHVSRELDPGCHWGAAWFLITLALISNLNGHKSVEL